MIRHATLSDIQHSVAHELFSPPSPSPDWRLKGDAICKKMASKHTNQKCTAFILSNRTKTKKHSMGPKTTSHLTNRSAWRRPCDIECHVCDPPKRNVSDVCPCRARRMHSNQMIPNITPTGTAEQILGWSHTCVCFKLPVPCVKL